MPNFIKVASRYVNLNKVSSIKFVPDKNRVVFNLNYSIRLDNGGSYSSRWISDYIYYDLHSQEKFEGFVEELNDNEYIIDNFITFIDYDHRDQSENGGMININEISSVKFAEKKRRIIVNLSNTVTIVNDGIPEESSAFVFINFNDKESYDFKVETMKGFLDE